MERIALSVTLFLLIVEGMAMIPQRWDANMIEPEVPAIRGGCFNGICIPYTRRHNFIAGEVMTKRKSKCTCKTEFEWLELPSGSYPSTLVKAKCLPLDPECSSQFDKCEVLKYKVPYLKWRGYPSKQESASVEANDEEYTMLPQTLRDRWQLFFKEIGVACLDEETYRTTASSLSSKV